MNEQKKILLENLIRSLDDFKESYNDLKYLELESMNCFLIEALENKIYDIENELKK